MIMKTFRAYQDLDARQTEEDRRTSFEEARKKNLSEILWKSYNNNVKLWSLRTMAEKKGLHN